LTPTRLPCTGSHAGDVSEGEDKNRAKESNSKHKDIIRIIWEDILQEPIKTPKKALQNDPKHVRISMLDNLNICRNRRRVNNEVLFSRLDDDDDAILLLHCVNIFNTLKSSGCYI